ncbi:SDR family NAD(P)-dependent oxidoreductase, partial [bacterium]|nr:SDR family NAD(P)-dependent oxidoreductase [bacterium]
SDISRWFSVPSWRRSPTPMAAGKDQLPVIIFHAGSPVELELIKELEKQALKPLVYEYASLYNNNARDALDPLSVTELTAIFNDFKHLYKSEPLTVLHLPLLPALADVRPHRRLQYVKKMALSSAISLAQALSESDRSRETKILFVTFKLHPIDEDDLLVPEKQLISGPLQVIPQEYQNLKCRIVDLQLLKDGKLSQKSLALLPLELESGSQCQRVALRNWRWEEDFSKLDLDFATPTKSLENRLRDNGVYLICGGFGGIGLTLAGYIAENSSKPKIALLSKTSFPERKLWQKIVQNSRKELKPNELIPNELQQSAIISKIYQWEQLGATVIPFSVDAADEKQIKAVVAELSQKFGKIDGLIHAAGVGGGKLILQTDARELERVLRPKVDACSNLAQIIDLGELDFAIFCSSLNSVLGGTGQIAYCAANAFLDALATSYRGRGQVISIAWDSWKDVGMAVKAASAIKPAIHRYSMSEIINTRSLSPATNWTLGEHQIENNYVLPGTAYLDIAYTSLKEAGFNAEPNSIRLEDFTVMSPLAMPQEQGGSTANLRIGISRDSSAGAGGTGDTKFGACAFAIHSLNRENRGDWLEHARAQVISPAPPPKKVDLESIKKRCTRIITEPTIDLENSIKVTAGRRWDFPVSAYFGDQEALAFMTLPADLHYDFSQHPLHPALLDRATAFMLADIENALDFLPFQFGSVNIYAPLTADIISYSRRITKENSTEKKSTTELLFDITIMNSAGDILLEIKRYRMLNANSSNRQTAVPAISDNKTISPALRSIIANGISPAEGADIFARSLNLRGEPVIYICTTDLETEREAARSYDQNQEISALLVTH